MEFIIKSPKYGEKTVLIDDEDWPHVSRHTWGVHIFGGNLNRPYITAQLWRDKKQSTLLLHRLIMNCPKDKIVDHINHNTLDNRKINLRICTRAENSYNQLKPTTKKTSIYKGVFWNKINKNWRSSIKLDVKKIDLGSFKDEVLAAKAYDIKAKELFGEFCYLNFKEGLI